MGGTLYKPTKKGCGKCCHSWPRKSAHVYLQQLIGLELNKQWCTVELHCISLGSQVLTACNTLSYFMATNWKHSVEKRCNKFWFLVSNRKPELLQLQSFHWHAIVLSVLAAGPVDGSGSQLLSNSLNLLSVASNLKNAQTLLSTLQKNLPANANLPANIKSLAARVLRAQGECVSCFVFCSTVNPWCDPSSRNSVKFLVPYLLK